MHCKKNTPMKNLLLAVALLLGVSASFAQTQSTADDRLLPVQKDMGLTMDVTGLVQNLALNSLDDPNGNSALLFRYYTKDDRAFRLGFGFNTISHRTNRVDSVGQAEVDFDSTWARTEVYIAPGIEKHFVGSRRLDPYVGASVLLGLTGKTTMAINTSTSDTLGTSTVKTDRERAGGSVFGLTFTGGFNYFVSKRLAIGAEYNFGFYNRRTGGDFSDVTVTTPVSGSGTVSRSTGSDLVRNSGFQVNATGGVTLSWFFARPPKEG